MLVTGSQEVQSSRTAVFRKARELAGSVPPRVLQTHRLQPEFGLAVARSDVDVRWLPSVLVLVGVEVEAVWSETVDGRQANLAAMVGETAILASATYPGLIR